MDAGTFYEKEYIALRAKLDLRAADIVKVEFAVIGAIAAIYSWILAHPNPSGVGQAIWLVPVFLCIFGFIRFRWILEYISAVEAYIIELERFVLASSPGPKGWESYYRVNKRTRFTHRNWFWVLLIVVTSSSPILQLVSRCR